MIDLTQIEIELGYGPDDETVLVTRGEMLELINRLRQAEKDASRYRWLRHMAEVDGAAEMMLAILISDDWDSAIDEAVNGSNN